jgi:hypothetical protein
VHQDNDPISMLTERLNLLEEHTQSRFDRLTQQLLPQSISLEDSIDEESNHTGSIYDEEVTDLEDEQSDTTSHQMLVSAEEKSLK